MDLDPEISEILELPDYFPLCNHSSQSWRLGSPSFRYEVEYLRPDGMHFYGLVVRGSYVELSRETCYRFNRDQYDLLSLVEESNRESQQIKNRGELSQYNTLQLARIKERAEKIHATLDRFMERQKIVTADKLSVRLEKNPDGSFSVLPVLLRKDGDSYTRMEADSLGRDSGAIRTIPENLWTGQDPVCFTRNRKKASGRCAGASGCLRKRPGRWQNIPGRFSVLKPLILTWECMGTGWFPSGNCGLRICLSLSAPGVPGCLRKEPA